MPERALAIMCSDGDPSQQPLRRFVRNSVPRIVTINGRDPNLPTL